MEINEWNNDNLKKNYKLLKKELGFNTANSKTYFGNNLSPITSNNNIIYDNSIGGGLLNFWGGVLQKFDKETLNLSLKIDDLDDYYFKISQNIPVSQVIHKNSKKNIYSNQENIECNKYVEEIGESIIGDSRDIIKKDTLIATTQNKNLKNCHCFIGCKKHNIFKTTNLDLNKNVTFINEQVIKIDFDKKKIITDRSSQSFNKIYLNAGPYYDQEILLESLENTQKTIKIKDSTSFTFPIFFKGKMTRDKKVDFNLTNYVFSINDKNTTLGHAQIYPPIDHINKSIFHHFFWNKFSFIKDLSINRLFWVRCYLNDEYAQIKVFNNNEKVNYIKNNKIKIAKNKFFEIFKKNFQNENFLPLNYFINSKTSSHYTADTNHIKNEILLQNENHYKNNIFFNDSLFWDNLPSESPTFSIMANALRNTDLYL